MMDVILKMNNFHVVQAQNGFQAFEKAAEAIKYQQQNIKHIVKNWDRSSFDMFDVIILDLNMPILDGYEACKKINKIYDEAKLLINQGEDSCSGLVKDLKPLLIACTGDNVDDPTIKANL